MPLVRRRENQAIREHVAPASTKISISARDRRAVRGARAKAHVRPQPGAKRTQAHASRRNDPNGSPPVPA